MDSINVRVRTGCLSICRNDKSRQIKITIVNSIDSEPVVMDLFIAVSDLMKN